MTGCTLHRRLALAAAVMFVLTATPRLHAQASDNVLSEKEVDSLRDAAYIPQDRIIAYEKILNAREQAIEQLLSKPRHIGFAQDMHDLLDQFGAIADELNDNLDEYSTRHRDVRKALPKLIEATERWSSAVRAPSDDATYNVVRRIALDSLKDMRDIATSMQTEQDAYFKAHPDAIKLEKERADENHTPAQMSEPR